MTNPSTPTGFEEIVMKRGETAAILQVRRSLVGVTLTLKVHPSIEEFFRFHAEGKSADVKGFGRIWSEIRRDSPPLQAYIVKRELDPITLDTGEVCDFNRVAHPLLDDGRDASREDGPLGGGGAAPKSGRTRRINLSILKLVGASEGHGVSFGIRGVYTTDQLREIANKVGTGIRTFYSTYLLPVEMSAIVSTQEARI